MEVHQTEHLGLNLIMLSLKKFVKVPTMKICNHMHRKSMLSQEKMK